MKKETKMMSCKNDLTWKAESLVHDAIAKTPKFKQAVKATIKELKSQDAKVAKIVAGKKK